MKQNFVIAGYLLLSMICFICEAGDRRPGKYSGVVIFDRWDGCTLYSGIYVMYVSEMTKDKLRRYSGNAIQIDAKEVRQLINPGDGLIGRFKYLGPAPTERGMNWVDTDGIRLSTSISIDSTGKPLARLIVENMKDMDVTVDCLEIGYTLLTKHNASDSSWIASDGPSFALITRHFVPLGEAPYRKESSGIDGGIRYAYVITRDGEVREKLKLSPRETWSIDFQFDVPDGEYDFLCGYGGSVHGYECVASNLVAFDVESGKAKIIEIER